MAFYLFYGKLRDMSKGKFFVIDGPDGCGKSSQVELLVKFLRQKGKKVLVVRDPGSTVIGDKIRDILLDPIHKQMTPMTELFLYFASRAQMVDEIIKPALKQNKIVICDRFLSSTLVYQGYAGGVGEKMVDKIWQMTMKDFKPDITIILDVPPERGLGRIKKTRLFKTNGGFAPISGTACGLDRMEQKKLLFHKKVRAGFIKLVKANRKTYRLIDGTKTIEEVHRQIEKIIDER